MITVLFRGVRGPFDGTVFLLPDHSWLFVHSNGTPIILAPTIELLIRKMRELGYVESDLSERELYLEVHRLDDPIIPFFVVPKDLLIAFEKGEIDLKEMADALTAAERKKGESP